MTVGRDRVDRLIDVIVAVPICSAVATRRAATIAVRLVLDSVPGAPARLSGQGGAPRVQPVDPARPGEADVMAHDGAIMEDDTQYATSVESISPVLGAELPIADYDHLAARQVIDRLRSLDADEVAVIAAHERAHRRRSTVLAALEQLGA